MEIHTVAGDTHALTDFLVPKLQEIKTVKNNQQLMQASKSIASSSVKLAINNSQSQSKCLNASLNVQS
jgi:hypothetical protein